MRSRVLNLYLRQRVEEAGRIHSPWARLGGGNFAYLIRISIKYGVDLKRFLECFWKAWKGEISTHGNMVVQLRVKSKDHGIFMITRRGEVVAQLKFDEEELEKMRQLNDSALSSMVEAWKEREYKGAWKQGIIKSETLKIGDLKLGLIGVRLKAKVVEKSEPRIVDTRNGRLLFSMAVVSDNTGTIRMPLRGRRVSMVSVGDTVLVEDAWVKDYLGELQLRVGRGRGKLTVEEESLGEEAN